MRETPPIKCLYKPDPAATYLAEPHSYHSLGTCGACGRMFWTWKGWMNHIRRRCKNAM